MNFRGDYQKVISAVPKDSAGINEFSWLSMKPGALRSLHFRHCKVRDHLKL